MTQLTIIKRARTEEDLGLILDDQIRCPYCIYRDEFKVMISLGA